MQFTSVIDEVVYSPPRLLNSLIDHLGIRTDADLCRVLEIPPSVLSSIRSGRRPIGASLLVRMHDVSGLDIRELRKLLGDRRAKFRMAGRQLKG